MDVGTSDDTLIPDEDGLLADFLDWYDHRQRANGDNHDLADRALTDGALVDRFLSEQPDSARAAAHRAELEQFLLDSKPIAQLAANAVSDWLEDGGLSDDSTFHEEVLPRVFGDYELLKRIGQGGMGVVYKAQQASLERVVAVKMLPPGLLQPDRVQRLADEAKLAGALNHPGIVAVFDADEHEGQPFYVMELVEGETLADRLIRNPPTEQDAVHFADEIAEAVEYAHASGVLHRDLKPTNVLVDATGRLRVTDFGLARRIDATISGESVSGTPSYMSPEQAVGGAVDQRADVYSLGAVLYEMLAGRPPHLGNSPLQTLQLVATQDPVDLRRLRPGLSRDLETVCHRCLQKNASNRYASVTQLRQELARIRRNEPVKARPIGPFRRAFRWARRHPTIAITTLVTALSLCALILIGAYALSSTNKALNKVTSAETQQRAALGRATAAEKQQRALTVELQSTLYRSRIARVAQLHSSGDVLSARRLFAELRSPGAEAGIEVSFLERMLFPEEITIPDTQVTDVAWSPDGQSFFTVSSDGRICRRTASGEQVASTVHQPVAERVAVHPDGGQIATSDAEGTIRLRDSKTLALHRVIRVSEVPLRQLMWHSDGKWLLVLTDDGLLVCVQHSMDRQLKVRINQQAASIVALSADGRSIAAAMQDGSVVTGDWTSLMESADDRTAPVDVSLQTISASPDWGSGLAWNADGTRLAVLRESSRVEVWRRAANEMSRIVSVEIPGAVPNNWSGGCQWLEKQLLVATSDGRLIALDGSDGTLKWSQPGLPLATIRVQPANQRWLTLSRLGGDSTVAVTSLSRMCVGAAFINTDVPVRSIVVANGGSHLVSRNVDGEISAHDLTDGSVHTIVESEVGASALAASAADSLVAATRETEVVFYRLPMLEEVARMPGQSSTVWTLGFSTGGHKLVSGDGNGTLHIHQTDPPRLIRSMDNFSGDIRDIAFADDDNVFGVVDDATVSICDFDSRVHASNKLRSTVNAIAFGDGTTLYAADAAGVISRMMSSNETSQWQAHRGPIWSLVRVGSRLISGGQDGSIHVWSASGEYLMTLAQLDAASVGSRSFPKHSRLFAATAAGRVHFWTYGSAPSP